MKILLVGNYVHDRQESMQRYARLLRDLLQAAGIEVEIIRPTPYFGCLKPSGHGIGKWLGYIDKFILFPFVLSARVRRERKKAASATPSFLVHVCDHSNAVYTKWLQAIPHVVTCHDVIAIQSARGLNPGQVTSWTGRILQAWILTGLRRSRYVVCVSEETRRQLLSLLPHLESRSGTIPNVLNDAYSPMSPDQARDLVSSLPLRGFFPEATSKLDSFVLHVGGNQWYKNREGALRIFARLNASQPHVKLIMVGQEPTREMINLVEKHHLRHAVLYATDVSDQQLRALYNLADALLFPSLREGFGWPIVEAQACGCPVVTSQRAPMSEIGGPAALYADPVDEDDFAAKLNQLLTETPADRARRQDAALRHASLYRPEPFLEKMLATYHHVLHGRHA